MKRSFVVVIAVFSVLFYCIGIVSASNNDKIVKGLKEALKVGFENAVKKVGIQDGFYKNANIKILMPDKLKNATDFLNQIGAKSYTEKLVKKMNRAAEAASPKAQAIFVDAVKKMKINDGLKILQGKDDEATKYLKSKTSAELKKEFYPIIKENMEKIGVIKAYNDFVDKYSKNPLLQKVNLDISDYVTDNALKGLFKMVAQEEKKIRKDPAARISDILKDVFGGMFK